MQPESTGSQKRRGDYLGKPEAVLTASDATRFWAKVGRRAADECWPWLASFAGKPSAKYGQFSVQVAPGVQRHLTAHKTAYRLSHGEVPAGQQVLHHCDNTACVNPSHLYLGNHKKNMEDAQARGRLHVPRPTAQKVADAQVDEMVMLVQSGMKRSHVAQRYGVSKAYMTRLMNGTLRQHRNRPASERVA